MGLLSLLLGGRTNHSTSSYGLPGEWGTALFSLHDGCAYLSTCICPCPMLQQTADLLGDRHRDASEVSACYACLLSCILDAPVVLCCDQFTTRALDRLADRPDGLALQAEQQRQQLQQLQQQQQMQDAPLSTLLQNATSYLLVNGQYGTAAAANLQHHHIAWENDGVGWDLRNQSEDWWPISWCRHYLCELCASVFLDGGRCLGGTAPRFPLCFSLALALCYPALICPTACFVRRMVITEHHIREGHLTTCALILCCLPCAIVQTAEEAKHPGGSSSSSMAPESDNSMFFP